MNRERKAIIVEGDLIMRQLSIFFIVILLFSGSCSCRRNSGKAGKPTPMEPDAKKVLVAFRSALSATDWPRALSLCTQAVQDEAEKHASTAQFCRSVLPVEEITTCKRFNAYASKSRGSGHEVVEYRWSVSLKNSDDVYWFCPVRKEDAQWRLDFAVEPLSQYVESELAERKRQAAEYRRRRKVLLPKLQTVTLTLTPLKQSFALGKPMPFRLEMTNGGRETLYYDDQQVKVNNSMIVKDSKGREIAYTAGSFQTVGGYRPIEPDRTVVLFDGFDLASQYKIKRTGTYTVQFSGRGLSVGDRQEDESTEYGEDDPSFSLSDTCASNTVQIKVLRAGG
jgi:hypothetical protein